jgi:enoyl-CoA hydratase/carnithine racemase
VSRVPEAALVDARTDAGVRVLTLRREAKLNALSAELEQALAEALAHDEARNAGCVVLTGRGRALSVGADVGELRERTPEAVFGYYATTGGVYEQLAALPQPTVSAIGGYCLGGGLELALATDFRIADETAVFGFPEVGLGILPSSGGTERITRLLGPARAKELILLRERIDAHEALAWGLVSEVVRAGEALDRALALAHELAALPRLAASVVKRAIDAVPESSRAAGILMERLAYAMLAQTEDAHAAAEAFERRLRRRE